MLRDAAYALVLKRCRTEGAPGQKRFGNTWVDLLASGMVHAADLREAEPLERAFRRVVLHQEEDETPEVPEVEAPAATVEESPEPELRDLAVVAHVVQEATATLRQANDNLDATVAALGATVPATPPARHLRVVPDLTVDALEVGRRSTPAREVVAPPLPEL